MKHPMKWIAGVVIALLSIVATQAPLWSQPAVRVVAPQNVSVKQYGAKGDGVTDDTAAIVAARNAVAATKGVVFFPVGRYKVTSSLSLPDGVTFQGEARGATILEAPNGCNFAVIDADGQSNVAVQDMTIRVAAGGTPAAGSHGVRIRGNCSNPTIARVTADGFRQPITIGGKYGAGGASNAQYTVRVGGSPTAGAFTLNFWPLAGGDAPTQTAPISVTDSASAVQSAVDAAVGAGLWTVTGGPGPDTPWVLTAAGANAGLPLYMPYYRITTNLSGGFTIGNLVAVEETVRGGQWVRHARLTQVTAQNSPTSWGIELANTEDAVLDWCVATGNWLDGVKGVDHCWNSKITNFDFSRNGVSAFRVGGTPAQGDGMDLYAGGERTLVANGTCIGNFGNGIQLKNDSGSGANLSGYGTGKFGINRKLDIVNVRCDDNQAGCGIIMTEGQSGITDFSMCHVTITGGSAEGNSSHGLAIIGRYVTAQGFRARRNGTNNIYVGPNARFVDLLSCHALHPKSPNAINVLVEGRDGKIIGGHYVCTDSDANTDGTDPTALTKNADYNIRFNATAQDWVVEYPSGPEGTANIGPNVRVIAGATNIITHQFGTLTPNSSAIGGSIGSTYLKTDTGVQYAKISGTGDSVNGWATYVTTGGTNIFTALNTFQAGADFGGSASGLTAHRLGATFAPTSTTGTHGVIDAQNIAAPTGTFTGGIIGVHGQGGSASGNAQNFNSSTGAMVGVRGSIVHRGTGTVTSAYGLHAAGPTISNSGSGGLLSNAYGLFVDKQNGTGVTTGWGVFQSDSGDTNSFAGEVRISTAGKGLSIKEGTNARLGVATLTSGTITVGTTAVTANSRILLTPQDNNTTGAVRVSARVAGTSFTITSNNAADSGVVAWTIVEPAP